MTEEVAGSPKPDRSDVSPPKVLVQQASEDKGDGNTANDTATTNGSEEHTLVNGEVSREETKEKPSQPSPETGESSGHQAKSNDVQESPEPADKNSDNATPEAEEKPPRVAPGGISADAIKGDDASGHCDRSHNDLAIVAIEHSGDNENCLEQEQQPAEAQIEEHSETFPEEKPHSETPKEANESSLDGQSAENSQPPSDGTRSKTPDQVTTIVPHKNDVVTEKNGGQGTLSTPEETKPTEDRPRSKTPDAATPSNDNSGGNSAGKASPPNAQEITGSPAASPVPSVKSVDNADKDSRRVGQEEPVSTPEIQKPPLLEMVANGETELLSNAESDRKTPVLDKDDSARQTPVQDAEDSDRKTPIDNSEGVPNEPTAADDSSGNKPEKTVGEGGDSEIVSQEKLGKDEAGSVTSEEPTEDNHQDAYDASVSGNEDDTPEKPLEVEKHVDGGQTGATEASVRIPTPETRGATPGTTKATSSLTPEPSAHEQDTAAPRNESPTKEISADDSLATTVVPSPARSPKSVRFAKPQSGSDSDSDVVIVSTSHTHMKHGENVENSQVHNLTRTQTPEVGIVNLLDLSDVEGMETPPIDEEVRETESSSKLSIHSEGSGTVVVHEAEEIATSSSLLEELKKEKESEMESLNERIAELRDEINRLEEEKETEHRKVDDLSLQIKRMTNDNADNVKTIQNNEEKIKTLEEQIEKYKRQEQQIRNGTTTPVVPSQPPKKSSVCVIL